MNLVALRCDAFAMLSGRNRAYGRQGTTLLRPAFYGIKRGKGGTVQAVGYGKGRRALESLCLGSIGFQLLMS